MLFVLIAPVVILTLVLGVPLAYRLFWPVPVSRPRLFLTITVTIALIIAAAAIVWYYQPFIGIGIAHPSPGTASSNATFESVVRNRFFVAGTFSVVLEYLLCRITQTLLGR